MAKLIIDKAIHIESKAARAAGRYSVSGVRGLYLDVKRLREGESTPVRGWVLRIMNGHKLNAKGERKPNIIERTIGYFPTVTLAEAREKAILWAAELRDGKDVGKRAAKPLASTVGMTFAEAAPLAYQDKKADFKSDERQKRQWLSSLELHAFPLIGHLPLVSITAEDVANVLNKPTDGMPFWNAKHSQAVKIQLRMSQVFDWAIVKGEVTTNPADRKGALRPHIRKYTDPANHHAAIPYEMIPQFMAALRNDDSLGARPLELTLLTGVRSSETRLATRHEIDLPKARWTVDRSRTKTKKFNHEVPLSRQAVALIEALPVCPVHPEVLFRGASGVNISDAAMLNTIRRIRDREFPDMKVTVHGLRSSIRDWIAERTDFSFEVGEAVLSHTVKGTDPRTVAAYLRTTYFDKRIELMQQWADFCSGVEPAPKVKTEAAALIEQLRELGLTADDIKSAL